jgi:hypothetical protein
MSDGDYGVVRFAIFAITVVANFSESNFACMTPLGFLFLLAAIGHAEAVVESQPASRNDQIAEDQIAEEESKSHRGAIRPAIF